MLSSSAILERFRRDHAKDIDLTLRPAYRDLLAKLGNPHLKLPPVFHVAGTNGKGSTCAFLRAILEAAGYRVHVYTSPHLVRFHERIRVAGELIGENELAGILTECEAMAEPGAVSYFEAATAAAFVAFARYPADFTILEVGLGGRLDATNVIDKPLASIITRISYDHREYLGETLAKIAREKAGIMREGVPCFTAAQPDEESRNALLDAAKEKHAASIMGDRDWHVVADDNGFRFTDPSRDFDLPAPALAGKHQYDNAGLAIAALSVLPQPVSRDAIVQGLGNVEWPARLQPLKQGLLADLLPPGWTLWLDGGHNDSAGEILAAQAEQWGKQDGAHSLHLVVGMLTTKQPEEFLQPLKPYIASVHCVAIRDEPLGFPAQALAEKIREAGIHNVHVANSVAQAITQIVASSQAGRILICGSLYLAGDVLRTNGL